MTFYCQSAYIIITICRVYSAIDGFWETEECRLWVPVSVILYFCQMYFPPPTPSPQNIYSNRTFSIFFRFFAKSPMRGGEGGRGYRNSRLGQNHRKFQFIPFIPSIIEWFPGDFLKFRGFPATFADFPWYNPRIDENWTSSVINCEQTTKHRKA